MWRKGWEVADGHAGACRACAQHNAGHDLAAAAPAAVALTLRPRRAVQPVRHPLQARLVLPLVSPSRAAFRRALARAPH